VSFRSNIWFSRLLIRKRKLAVFNKKSMKFSQNKPKILKIKNWHNWRWQCKRKSPSTSFFWMIRPPFSKKCTPKLFLWSTETSRLSRIKVKSLNYSMKLISTFLKSNKNLQLFMSFKKSLKRKRSSTKNSNKRSKKLKSSVRNSK